MMSRKLFSVLACAAITGAAFGCAQAKDSVDSQQSALDTADPAASVANEKPGVADRAAKGQRKGPHWRTGGPMRGGPGPLGVFKRALDEINLSDAQMKTVQSALDSACDHKDGARDGGHALMDALMKGIASGNVDESALQARIAAAVQEVQAHVSKDAAALNTVHETLTADQRQALVTNIRDEMKQHRERRAHGDGPRPPDLAGPHPDFAAPPPGKDGPRRFGGPGLMRAVHRLTLTEAQEQAIDSALANARPTPPTAAERNEHEQRLNAMLDAFAAPRFDARTLLDGKDITQHLQKRWTNEATLAKALVGILTAQQRAQLAEIARHAPMPPGPPPPDDSDEPEQP